MKLLKFHSLFFIFLCIFSCNTSNEIPVQKTKEEILVKTNQQVDSLAAHIVSNHQYSYYVPQKYKSEKLAVVFLFDPHANGKNAIINYTSISEKKNIALIASNYARNGSDFNALYLHVQNVLKEVDTLLNVDLNKIIYAGFSGGGRIALEIAKLQKNPMGVITAGSAGKIPESFHVKSVVISGTKDFNYIECLQYAEMFKNNINFRLLTFNGKHEWPPVIKFEEALDFIMKDQGRISSYIPSQEETMVLRKEKRQQVELFRFYSMKPTTWWVNRINTLKKKAEGESLENVSAQRLLAYIGMLSYTYTVRAVNTEKMEFINHCLLIYESVEPTNPDMYLFKACYQVKNRETEKAIESLRLAIENGLLNPSKIKKMPQLLPLHNDSSFQKLTGALK